MDYHGTKEDLASMFDSLADSAQKVMETSTTQARTMRAKGEMLAYRDTAIIIRSWTETHQKELEELRLREIIEHILITTTDIFTAEFIIENTKRS